jgi:phasin
MEANMNAKTKASKPSPGVFESAKTVFEMPKFDLPKMEVPAAFREIAEKGVSQAKENYEKLKAVAEEASDVMEETYATATKSGTDYGLKVIDAARANTNAAFDFFSDFIAVKSLSEAVELSSAHVRKQFDQMSEQNRELAAITQKALNESVEPLKSGFSKAFGKIT